MYDFGTVRTYFRDLFAPKMKCFRRNLYKKKWRRFVRKKYGTVGRRTEL